MLKAQKLSKADQQKIEAALAARVQRPTKQELKAQQLQDLRQSLHLAASTANGAGNQAENEKRA